MAVRFPVQRDRPVVAVEPFGVAQRDLRRVQRLAGRLEDARVQLRDAILAAHDSGESVRDIAPYAGMSPSRVHELLVEAREAVDADDP